MGTPTATVLARITERVKRSRSAWASLMNVILPAFCYRHPNRVHQLTLDQIKGIIQQLPIRSMNLGTVRD